MSNVVVGHLEKKYNIYVSCNGDHILHALQKVSQTKRMEEEAWEGNESEWFG